MKSVVVGLIAVALGLWSLVAYWYLFTEMIKGIIPILLLGGGLVAVVSGLRSIEEETRLSSKDQSKDRY